MRWRAQSREPGCIRAITRRSSQAPPRDVLIQLNWIMGGWSNHFKHAVAKPFCICRSALGIGKRVTGSPEMPGMLDRWASRTRQVSLALPREGWAPHAQSVAGRLDRLPETAREMAARCPTRKLALVSYSYNASPVSIFAQDVDGITSLYMPVRADRRLMYSRSAPAVPSRTEDRGRRVDARRDR